MKPGRELDVASMACSKAETYAWLRCLAAGDGGL